MCVREQEREGEGELEGKGEREMLKELRGKHNKWYKKFYHSRFR